MSEQIQTYTVNEVKYRLEPLSWQQTKWLIDHIFGDLDMTQLDYAHVHDLLREKGPLMMAICLLKEGETRGQQAQLEFAVIQQRAQEFAGELTSGEVSVFGIHFFRCCRPDQMGMLMRGKVLQAEMVKLVAEQEADEARRRGGHGENGSNGASSPSAEEISRKSVSFSASGDPLIQIRTSDEASSDRRLITASSVGSA